MRFRGARIGSVTRRSNRQTCAADLTPVGLSIAPIQNPTARLFMSNIEIVPFDPEHACELSPLWGWSPQLQHTQTSAVGTR
jgi:hypothetical protein